MTNNPTRLLNGVRHTGALPALGAKAPAAKRTARATKAVSTAMEWMRSTSFWVGA